jgi:hypothetical protein
VRVGLIIALSIEASATDLLKNFCSQRLPCKVYQKGFMLNLLIKRLKASQFDC